MDTYIVIYKWTILTEGSNRWAKPTFDCTLVIDRLLTMNQPINAPPIARLDWAPIALDALLLLEHTAGDDSCKNKYFISYAYNTLKEKETF